ncbi:NAD(P)/FAD-dependent oxidoreductase [Nostocoides sp. F2B08]|uniref:NAD(P)/FAD-dependent oxidoreductase n=1 Tax=Nostocoides sp. F2B08 TaxID=2653936 RepID=UPI001D055B37|nr:NAD(P)/FAD-dependent oxidoreductase [Tetrasphaera sp. F2B08]
MDADVVVIGAGLAGLQCARELTDAGLAVTVLEAGDAVGGRVRTDEVDGFLCDRGFQVLNPAYPAVRRLVDVDALRLQQFEAGVLVRAADGWRALGHPLKAPGLLAPTLRSGLLRPGEIAALVRWMAPAMVSPQGAAHDEDAALDDALDLAGVEGPLRRVLDRFLAGVIADTHGRTSANFTRLLLRSFALGAPGLPAGGMRALPEQIAAPLADVRLGARVQSVETSDGGSGSSVRTEDGEVVRADHVVIAADPVTATGLAGLSRPEMKGLVTWWFAAPEPPDARALLAVDGRNGPAGGPPGPVWNAAVVTAAAPSYSSDGRVLVEATTLLDRPDGDCGEGEVLDHLADMYRCSTSSWELVTRHRIPQALPAVPPPLRLRRPVRVREGVYVCGDHRDTASIQGALVSGQRAARAVIADRS